MEIPKHIENIMQRILESEERWKANYMGVWGFATFHLKPIFENTRFWDVEQQFSLPASKQGARARAFSSSRRLARAYCSYSKRNQGF